VLGQKLNNTANFPKHGKTRGDFRGGIERDLS